MKKLFILILFAIAITMQVHAMIHTLSFDELVKNSEFIFVAKISEQTPITRPDKTFPELKNTLTIEKTFKGTWNASEPLVVFTLDTKGEWQENNVEIPAPQKRVVLFLKKTETGDLWPVNGIQGVWPIEDGKDQILGMGTGVTFDHITTEVAFQQKK